MLDLYRYNNRCHAIFTKGIVENLKCCISECQKITSDTIFTFLFKTGIKFNFKFHVMEVHVPIFA